MSPGTILKIIAGLIAWLMIGISRPMMASDLPLTPGHIAYSALLILSVIFLHWALRSFLTPISRIPHIHASKLRNAVGTMYAKGFFAGVVGLGYMFLAFHVYALLDRTVTERPT